MTVLSSESFPDQRKPSLAETTPVPLERWTEHYARRVLVHDSVAVGTAGLLAVLLRFGEDSPVLRGVLSYYLVAAVMALGWLAVLGLSRCYEPRFLIAGTEEYRRVTSASLRLFGAVGFIAYATKTDVARGFLLWFFPLGLLGLLLGRQRVRRLLARQRSQGSGFHRTVVIGSAGAVRELVERLQQNTGSGFQVVGVCVTGGVESLGDAVIEGVPIVGTLTSVRRVVESLGVDTVAVAGASLGGEALRRLSYELEGTGIDLLMAPAVLNIAGNRISIRPVAGMPLLHVNEPELDGSRKVLKATFDHTTAAVGLVLLAPALLVLCLLVKLTSRGPALFRQTRVGRDGELFSVLKLRTMQVDAEQRLHEFLALNESDGGVLFKLRNDPRITPVGRWLRAWSLDELPQLVNVLRGQMSMVGPRPPLPTEVEKYEGHAHRRLLVKPGITGLWQVSGRSDLTWEESVRLDLQYVENWSLGLDIAVLAKTLTAVVRSSGAY